MPRLGLAVSGGPDSLALLLLAQQAMPGRIAAATVDHRLRPESAAEAAFVAGICASQSIPHHILTPYQPITGNVQSAAREMRYRLLKDWADAQALPFIATAHHADDQLETLLMRLARGSGLSGLAGIRRRNGPVLRPLLAFEKMELVAICRAAGLTPVNDPSNSDHAFDRVRMRRLLADHAQAFAPRAAQRTADAMQQAEAALQWVVHREAAQAIAPDDADGLLLHAAPYPREIQRRLLAEAMARLGDPPRGDRLNSALDRLRSGQPCSLGAHLCVPADGAWHITPAPPRAQR